MSNCADCGTQAGLHYHGGEVRCVECWAKRACRAGEADAERIGMALAGVFCERQDYRKARLAYSEAESKLEARYDLLEDLLRSFLGRLRINKSID